ncbi:MAG: hypothetical protein HYR56_30005 [Acidobacteria bacterium]|nr:hypothetical protein [Acidobacteriota bacterium]MBI3427728.1 hypothetical protein [Acidobacteriota bacterium]
MAFRRFAWICGVTLLVMALNVGGTILYMVVYSYLINPGHDGQFYQAHVQVAAPYCSIIFGAPLMFVFCRWLGRRWEPGFAVKAALLVWLVYATVDVLVLAGAAATSGVSTQLAVLTSISQLTKLVAAYYGGLSASRQPQSA